MGGNHRVDRQNARRPLAALAAGVLLILGIAVLLVQEHEDSSPCLARPSGLDSQTEVCGHRYPATRVRRVPLAAYRSDVDDLVAMEGTLRPQWIHSSQIRRRAIVSEKDGSLQFRLKDFPGGRLEGEVSLLPSAGSESAARARFQVGIKIGAERVTLFDELLASSQVVPYALEISPAGLEGSVLELTVTHERPQGARVATAAWIDPVLVSIVDRERAPEKRAPNIVLITADTTRQDELGPYGGGAKTPTLNDLAASGVTFGEVHSVAFGTTPSHSSLMTSQHAARHGVYNNRTPLDEAQETLAEVLASAGYTTAGFVSGTPLTRKLAMNQGFDLYDDTFALDPNSGLDFYSFHERRAEDTVSEFLDWMAVHGSETFFVWIHFYDPHQPYNPPPPDAALYVSRDAQQESLKRPYPVNNDGVPVYLHSEELQETSAADLRSLSNVARAHYRGEISYVDRQLRRVLEGLEQRDVAEDTAVIFTADHGENFLERDPDMAFGHAGLHSEVTRVPVVIAARGRIPAGTRDDRLAGSIDIAPTILELAGVSPPPSWQGRSLLAPAPSSAEASVILEGADQQEFALRTPNWLYRVRASDSAEPGDIPEWMMPGHQLELYDLSTDPHELNNVYREDHPALPAILARIDAFRERGFPTEKEEVTSPEHLEALRALGYVE